jgi:hypothetical protein
MFDETVGIRSERWQYKLYKDCNTGPRLLLVADGESPRFHIIGEVKRELLCNMIYSSGTPPFDLDSAF